MTEIIVYSKPKCVQCDATIRKLDKLGADYRKVDVTEDPEALARIKALGYLEAPVVVVGDENWSGFKPHHLEWAAKFIAEETDAAHP